MTRPDARKSCQKGDRGNIIVIKKEEIVEAGSHGGSWKIAYADFVTAMMAFFLLMWLTQLHHRAISAAASPTISTPSNAWSHASSGSGKKPFGGHTPFDQGDVVSDRGAESAVRAWSRRRNRWTRRGSDADHPRRCRRKSMPPTTRSALASGRTRPHRTPPLPEPRRPVPPHPRPAPYSARRQAQFLANATTPDPDAPSTAPPPCARKWNGASARHSPRRPTRSATRCAPIRN